MPESELGRYDHAVVVCTRNRPDEVRRLLDSLRKQSCTRPFLVAVVDASDPVEADLVRAAVENEDVLEAMYVAHEGSPSLARQRNAGVEQLPEGVEIVHFLDDDVSLHTGYLETLSSIFFENPDIGGAGGRVLDAGEPRVDSRWRRLASRLFLLESRSPGKVLPSGGLTGAQSVALDHRVEVECLGGCASYRREIAANLRFDDRLVGYSMDEDLDFSYRAGRVARLVVDPNARLVHHLSPTARHSVRESRRDLLVHRYWFIEKNLRHPLKKPAFWWKILGSYLMASLSRNPEAGEARKGILEGVSIVLRRAHPLL